MAKATTIVQSRKVFAGRRNFLGGATALVGAGALGLPRLALAESPPEIDRIRVLDIPAICLSPEYLADQLLRLEGFSTVEYPRITKLDAYRSLHDGLADISVGTAPGLLGAWETGSDIVALAPIHGGCYELFAHDPIRSVRDLKGKRVAIEGVAFGTAYYYVASIAAYIGLDPQRDLHWIEGKSTADTMQLFIDGKADAFLGFPPQPQRLRTKNVGRVIVNTTQEKPWNQYNCCLITARRGFVQEYPVATKRAIRAILKTADWCSHNPEQAARLIVTKGYESSYEVALEVLKPLSYTRWRTHDPDDTFRFHGLRLHEAGILKTDPNKLIARGTDWRFLDELKKELRA